uniref:Uncharacterized protein n=1 Tax=Rhizophora mucronata TaxID=61149 RepID=A0A2P2P8F5_RHIMU
MQKELRVAYLTTWVQKQFNIACTMFKQGKTNNQKQKFFICYLSPDSKFIILCHILMGIQVKNWLHQNNMTRSIKRQ